MKLREADAKRIVGGLVPENVVLHERLLARRNLFKPGQAEAMCGKTCDHIVVAIPIDIERKHLRATPG